MEVVGRRAASRPEPTRAPGHDGYDLTVFSRSFVAGCGGERTAPTTVVIIVDWNAGELVTRCLGALARQTVRPETVMVVDNASASETWRHVVPDTLPIEMIRLADNSGFAAGTNRGIALVPDAEWVALLNPDAFPEPDWLERLLAAARGASGVLVLRIPSGDGRRSRRVSTARATRMRTTGLALASRPRRAGRARREASPRRCSAPAPRPRSTGATRSWRSAGSTSSFFCYFEDVDLAFRLRLAGHRCLYVPDAVVHHVGSATSGRRSDFSVYHGHRNLVWTFVKNMPGPLLALYWPHHLLLNLISLVWFTLRGQGRAIWRAKWDARSRPAAGPEAAAGGPGEASGGLLGAATADGEGVARLRPGPLKQRLRSVHSAGCRAAPSS